MNLRNEFLEFIKRNKLFDLHDRVLLTVSGGLDSVVMVDLFHVCGIDFGIAHCNFKLRGYESDGDEDFVKALAKKYDKPLYTNHFKTRKFADEHGISIQMAARELRYTWFETIRESKEYSVIATAHHKDDSVETILFNLIKGTGLDGVGGIPVRNGNVIRPLLFATRNELEDYASRKKINWRKDSSNMSTDYARNKIRLEVIPKLLEINPGFKDSIAKSVSRINEIRTFHATYVEKIFNKAVKVEGTDTFINKTEPIHHN